MKMIAKGAEGEIFGLMSKEGAHILKRRVVKKYRMPELDSKIRQARTKREAKVLHAAKLAGVKCPFILGVDIGKTEILMEKIAGKRLREYLIDYGSGKGRKGKNGDVKIREKPEKILAKAGAVLAKLHNAGLVHGDYSTANIIVMIVMKGGEIAVIDFGLAEFSSSIEDKATDVLVFKKSTNEGEFGMFWKGYAKESKNAKEVSRQLGEIEKRGRYVARAQAG
ncbi:MAG: KEOPS complex kinase/ATPase Bud32 [Candidatus Micrarchaeota archaeon]